ncbi:rod shape-determining protein MreC [Uliginosibacterium sp. 31-16]|uniref:rod shape-determining protein MreC n=1 Tax=Uliginosibacterium sp. 31-16 TaxID=3068315 RepID=UPI00273F7504|nr:rod shape-determining protein MreC [Uliginosibacterium sp. 31-16]MDP5238671.1 rod shape-determining protein MreC [Uliginosibacterium sp. 31-16]
MASHDHQTPPFFKRGLPPAARLTIYLALSFSLLVADLRLHYLETLRQALSVLTYPLQIAAATPADFVSNASDYFSGLISVQRENKRLKTQQLNMASQVLFTEQLQRENIELRGLLAMQASLKVRSTAAEIIFTARDPFSRKVILNKGGQQDIEPGSPVVDPLGVIGQVTRVFPLHAEVTLLSDKEQAIPVIVERSGLRAVMFGTGNGLMELKFLAANAEVKPGDRILTSGLDGVFAPGLPVATVLKVTRDSAESFARILCRPTGSVERNGPVLVLSRTGPRPQRPADDDSIDPRRASGGRIRQNKAEAPASAPTPASAPAPAQSVAPPAAASPARKEP